MGPGVATGYEGCAASTTWDAMDGPPGARESGQVVHATHSSSVAREDVSPLLHKYYDLFVNEKASWGPAWFRAVDAFMRFETMCGTPVRFFSIQ